MTWGGSEMIQILPFVLTMTGAAAVYLGGRGFRSGWAIGFLGQFIALYYAFAVEHWGWILWALIFGSIYARHWIRWAPDISCKKSCKEVPSEVEKLQFDGVG
jgi:hypothetical protein